MEIWFSLYFIFNIWRHSMPFNQYHCWYWTNLKIIRALPCIFKVKTNSLVHVYSTGIVNTDRSSTINRFMLLDKLVLGKVSECLKVTLHQISLVICIPWNVNMCPCSVSQQLTDLYCRQNKNQRIGPVYFRCIHVLIYWETEYFSRVSHHDLMD